MNVNCFKLVFFLCVAHLDSFYGMEQPKKDGPSSCVVHVQGATSSGQLSPRSNSNTFATLACLAARCMAHHAQLLSGDNIQLIAPSDQTCVREVILRELIKPHIFPLTITESFNKESVHLNGSCGLDVIPATQEVVSGACDGKIVFCNKKSLGAGTGYITSIPISTLTIFQSAQPEILLGSDGGRIYKMDYKTKNIDSDFKAHELTINGICVNNSLIASCSNDKTVKVWEKSSNKSLGAFNNFEQSVRCIEWLDENILISGCSEGKIKLWDVAYGKLTNEHQYAGNPRIWGMGTLKKKKQIIAAFNTGRISLVDSITLQEISQWYGHGATISSLSCDTDEKYFATSSWDEKARLWDPRMRACAATFIGHTHWVQKVKCDGNEIVTGSRDHSLRSWDIRKIRAIDAAPLPLVAAMASQLKDVPLFKEQNEREALLGQITNLM